MTEETATDFNSIEQLMADLAGSLNPSRDPMDRYREFRNVFLGTDEGKRVLHDILAWGRIYKSKAARGDPYETYLRCGEENMAIKILTAIHKEPKPKPTQQQSERPDG